MIWKVVSVLSVTLCVLGHQDAISEQRVTIHFQKPFLDSIKSDPQDQNSRENPSYEFSYKVNDPETGDIKGQHEIKAADEVTGNYWLIEPTGKKRTVNYQANNNKGFKAQIEYTASLKNEQDGENIEISQIKNIDETIFEKNNDDGIENNVTEMNYDVEEANIGNNDSESDIEQSKEENQEDNEKNETENINNVLTSNIDRTGCQNRDPNNQKITSPDKNRTIRLSTKSRRKNRIDNSLEKGQREKNKTHVRFPLRMVAENIESNHDAHRNSKDAVQEITKSKSNKRHQHRQNNHINLPQNSNITNQNIEKGLPIATSQGQNSEVSRKKNISDTEKNSKVHYNPGDVQPNVERSDMPDSEIYEHRIHILHPKFIPSNAKDEQT